MSDNLTDRLADALRPLLQMPEYTTCKARAALVAYAAAKAAGETDASRRLAEIEAAANADAADLEKMRDGTNLTRSGLVSIIAYQQQELAAARADADARVQAAMQAQREACARVVDNWNKNDDGSDRLYAPEMAGSHGIDCGYRMARQAIAAAIRASGPTLDVEGCSEALRDLACYFSAGGYNAADPIDPSVFVRKIKEGSEIAERGAIAAAVQERDRVWRDAVAEVRANWPATGMAPVICDAILAEVERRTAAKPDVDNRVTALAKERDREWQQAVDYI